MKTYVLLAVVLAAVSAATVAYLATMRAAGIPDTAANVLLVGLYFGGLGWAVHRWPS